MLSALLAPLALSSALHAGTEPGDITSFTLTDRVSDSIKTVIVNDGDPDTPDLPSYEPVTTSTTSVSLTAVLGNVNPGTGAITPLNLNEITPETNFDISVGGLSWTGTLGQDPTYTDANKATKRSVFIPVNFHEVTGNPVGANGIRLAWTSTKLTVTIARANTDQEDKGSPFAETLIGGAEPGGGAVSVKTQIPLSITFGTVVTADDGIPSVAFASGTVSVTTRTVGSGDSATPFDLSSVSVTGALDTTPPTITAKTPAANVIADDGTVTLTGKVTDGHGIELLRYIDQAVGADNTIENTTLVKGPPGPLEAFPNWWGTTEWNWTLPLTNLPYGATQLEIRATDSGGNLKTLPIILYRKLPARFVGRWDALLDAEPGAKGLPGYLSIMVTQTGVITGNLRLRGMTAAKPVTGFWNDDGIKAYVDKDKPGAFLINGALQSAAQLDPAKLTMTLDVSLGTTGQLGAVALGTGFRVTLSSSSKLAADSLLLGRFNGYLDRDPTAYGHGHFSIATVNTGVTTITGRTADGTTLTGSGIVGPQGQMPIFISLYGNKGSLHSLQQVDATTGAVTPGTAVWFRPATLADKQFPAGINVALATTAARYTAPVKDQRILGLTLATAMAIWGGDGTTGNVTQNVSVGPAPANKITPVGGTAAFTATVDAAKGLISGTFKLPTTPAVAAPYSAIIVGNRVFGHYIAPGATGATLKRYGFFTLEAAVLP